MCSPPNAAPRIHWLQETGVKSATTPAAMKQSPITGTIFTEKIFDIDGLGLWSLQAVAQRDLPVVAATALFGAAVLIISNIVVDVIYSVLDPRVRLS